ITIVASRGEDEAVVGQNEYRNEENGEFAVHSYTDRPIYRPGQLIYYKSIVRRKLESAARYSVPAGQRVTVEVRDPTGERIHQKQLTCNSYGSVFGEIQLSPEAPTGVYSMLVKVNDEEHTHDIVIASYHKPEFTVNVTPSGTKYVRGDEVE